MTAVNFKREPKLKTALLWLQEQLAPGKQHYAGGLILLGAEAGHAERTLKRASKLLQVQKEPVYSKKVAADMKQGVEGWLWSLLAVDTNGGVSARSPQNARRKRVSGKVGVSEAVYKGSQPMRVLR